MPVTVMAGPLPFVENVLFSGGITVGAVVSILIVTAVLLVLK